jgi:hypothetical protein
MDHSGWSRREQLNCRASRVSDGDIDREIVGNHEFDTSADAWVTVVIIR